MEQPQLKRTALDIQRAHDLLIELLILDRRHGQLSERAFMSISASISVLCWALGHEHNNGFAEALEGAEKDMLDSGMVLKDVGELRRRK